MVRLKVRKLGSSFGVILPKEARDRLRVEQGDFLFLTPSADGSYRITAYNPDFQRQMEVAEKIMHDDREMLRVLAK